MIEENTKPEQPGRPNAINTDEISLKDLILNCKKWIRYLLSKWVLIVVFGLVGSGIAIAYALLKKPNYTAVTTFVLEEGDRSSSGLGQYAGLISIAGIDLGSGGGGIFHGDNIIELYKSRTMVQKTLLTEISTAGKKELLIDRFIDFTGLKTKWCSKLGLKSIDFNVKEGQQLSRLQDSLLGKAVEMINKDNLVVTKPDKKLSIIKVEVNSKDEIFTKNFNDQIVQNVNDFYVQTKTKKALQNLAILQKQTDSVRNVLNGAISTSIAVADATPNLNLTRSILRAPAQKSQVNAEANKVILSELIKNLELAKLSLRRETPLIQVVDVPIYPLNSDRVGKLKAIVIGGILAGFLTTLFLITRRVFSEILA